MKRRYMTRSDTSHRVLVAELDNLGKSGWNVIHIGHESIDGKCIWVAWLELIDE